MAVTSTCNRLSVPNLLLTRHGAWTALIVALVVIVGMFGVFRSGEEVPRTDQAPLTSESALAEAQLDGFPDAQEQSVLIVATREDGQKLSEADLAALADQQLQLSGGDEAGPAGPAVSEDELAAVLPIPIDVGVDNGENAETIAELRSSAAEIAPEGLTL